MELVSNTVVEVVGAPVRPRRQPAGTGRKTHPCGPCENASLHFHIPAGRLLDHTGAASRGAVFEAVSKSAVSDAMLNGAVLGTVARGEGLDGVGVSSVFRFATVFEVDGLTATLRSPVACRRRGDRESAREGCENTWMYFHIPPEHSLERLCACAGAPPMIPRSMQARR